MATHSSLLAWETPRTEEPGGLQSMGSRESDTAEGLDHHHHQLNSADTSSQSLRQRLRQGRLHTVRNSSLALGKRAVDKSLCWLPRLKTLRCV